MLKHYMAKQSIKFEVSHLSHSRDTSGETKNLNGSQGWFVLGGLGLATVNLCTKFEICTFTHYKI